MFALGAADSVRIIIWEGDVFKKRQFLINGSVCCIAAAAITTPAFAQDTANRSGELQEIVVTAQKRSENLQKVPIAVSTATPEQLATAGVRTTQDLAVAMPGLQLLNIGGALTPRIRGVGSGFTAAGFESPVATYVDGVYFAFGADIAMDLSDATQVAVIKGPQGTLFGRNATGGVLQVTTRDPSHDFHGNFQTSFDNYLTTRSNAFVTGGLSDTVSASLAASFAHQGKGYGENILTGHDTYQQKHAFTIHGKIKAEIGDNTVIKLSGDYTNHGGTEATIFRPFPGTNTIYPITQPTGLWDTASSVDATTRYHGGGGSLTIEHEFNSVKLTSISAYRDSYHSFNFTPVPTQTKVLDVYVPETSRQFTQEIQLASDSSGPLIWTVGGFYFYNKAWQRQVSTFGAGFPVPILVDMVQASPAEQTTKSEAVFAQATYKITDSTRFTAGIRYTWEEKDFDGQLIQTSPVPFLNSVTPGTGHLTFQKPTWRLSLDHDLTPEVTAYISYNRGVKSGGFNIRNPNSADFQPERLDAYEGGIKSELFDRSVRFNAAGFYYDYSNIQVVLFPGGTTVIVNGPKAELYGIDADLEARLTDQFTINASASWLHAKFKSFPNAEYTIQQPGGEPGPTFNADAAGNDIPYDPHFTYTIGATYTVPVGNGEVAFNATDSYNSGFYGEANNFMHQKSYHFVNASVAWKTADSGFVARLFVNNILNEAVASQMSTLGNLAYIADYTNPPRIIGGSIQIAF